MSSHSTRTEDEITLALRAAGCVFAEDEAALIVAEAMSATELDDMVARRVAGEPLEVIVGWAQFCGLRVAIDPRVFVPRRRTEILVSEAIRLTRPGAVVVDLCCGSGALGLAVRAAVPDVELFAADIDPAAVVCARKNLRDVGEVFEGDLFAPLPAYIRGTVQLLLVNAPYVPTAKIDHMPPEARDFESRVALDGGEDGLDIHRRVAGEASTWLAHRGTLLIETSESQVDEALDILARNGLTARSVYSEEHEATVVLGTLV
jgi:release factor glutamine methyltransferase